MASSVRYRLLALTSTKFSSVTIPYTSCSRHLHVIQTSLYDPRKKHANRQTTVPIIINYQKRNISQATYDNWFSVESPPISYAYSFLTSIHDYTGLPWWASIVLATFLLRSCVTLPIYVLTSRNNSKLELLMPEVKKLAVDLKSEVLRAQREFKWSPRQARMHYVKNMKRHYANLYARENCHPGKNLILPWVQIPIWISTSLALRNMSGMFQVDGSNTPVLCTELANEGTLWFSNLLNVDPIGLPLIFCITNFLLVEMHYLRVKNPKTFHKILTYGFRGLNIIMFPIAASVPSSMSFYWACSSTYGLLQNILILTPTLRRTLRIPETSSESKTPFKDMQDMFKLKYLSKKEQIN